MKLTLNGYNVTISAKLVEESKCSTKRTTEILNELAMICSEASESYAKDGYKGLSALARDMFNEIYNALDKVGVFDNHK